MAIVNRECDASQQKDSYLFNWAAGGMAGISGGIFPPGTTLTSGIIPAPGVLSAVQVSCLGASVAPTSQLAVGRFIPGAGLTLLTGLGASFTIPIFGISGSLGVSLVAAGSTLLNLMAGDVLIINCGVNSATSVDMSVILKKTQDIVAHFGSQT